MPALTSTPLPLSLNRPVMPLPPVSQEPPAFLALPPELANPLTPVAPAVEAPKILPSPIAAEAQGGLGLMAKDQPVKASALERAKITADSLTYRLPKVVAKGLKGDSSVGFSDQMLLANTVPYFLGGATLAGVAGLASGSKLPVLNAAVGVGLYMLAQTGVSRLIREAWHVRTGLDLNQLYKTAKSDDKHPTYERLYASVAWPRTDLLPATGKGQTVEGLANRFGIPEDANDRKGQVAKRIHQLIGQDRATEMIGATTMAAVGAGYIARSQAWGVFGEVPDILMGPGRGHLFQRLAGAGEAILSHSAVVLHDLKPSPDAHWGRKAAFTLSLAALAASTLWTAYMITTLPGRPKYDTPSTKTPAASIAAAPLSGPPPVLSPTLEPLPVSTVMKPELITETTASPHATISGGGASV
jgi:hypothetical protein